MLGFLIQVATQWQPVMPSVLASGRAGYDIWSEDTIGKITGVKVTKVTTTTAKVQWQKNQRAVKYIIRLLTNDHALVSKRTTSKHVVTLDKLTTNTDYLVQVRGLRKKQLGAWSKAVSFTTAAPEESLYEQYQAVAGSSTGQWQNLTFGTSGDASTTVEIDPDGQATFTIDLDGLVFGLVNPDPKTYVSTYDEAGAVFTAEDDDLFGDLTITITSNGNDTANISLKAVDVPVTSIYQLTASGILYDDAFDLNYQITFDDGSTADGIMNLTKTSE